jgi:hypothetical protein
VGRFEENPNMGGVYIVASWGAAVLRPYTAVCERGSKHKEKTSARRRRFGSGKRKREGRGALPAFRWWWFFLSLLVELGGGAYGEDEILRKMFRT